MYKLFIDDERDPIENFDGEWVVCRTIYESIDCLYFYGCPIFISFDHDLGGDETAIEIVNWLIDKDMDENGQFIPQNFDFYVHSQNPIGKQNIENKLNGYLNFRKKEKMKIGIFSDVHLEFWNRYGLYENDIVQKCNNSNCDIILNAGDTYIGPHFKQYHETYFEQKINKPYYMVRGNHDYYNDMFENDLQSHILSNGMKLVCATLWTNFRNENIEWGNKVLKQISDYSEINFGIKSPVEVLINSFNESCEFIKNEKPDIVMTHFMPFTKSIAPIYQNDTFLNTYFCNDLDNFVDGLEKKPIYWICGHTHWRHQYEHKNIKVICNPLGYPGENKGEYNIKIIEV